MAALASSFLTLSAPVWEETPPPGTDALWLFGPTASGKSELALSLAARLDAVIINADASQLYKDLCVLTARPDAADMQAAPHRLYGVLDGNQVASAGIWLGLVGNAIAQARAAGKLPLLVGGTGMYLQSLLSGIAPIPTIDPAIRLHLQQEVAAHGLEALYRELQTGDPALASKLKPGDTQRILRGVEVLRGSDQPLSQWQAMPREKILPELNWFGLILLPKRETAYARIDQRAERMWPDAVEEVRMLVAKHYPADAPIMKAIGVPEIQAYLRGEMTKEGALGKLQQHTRNYAKRQLTWARGQFLSASFAATGLQ